MGSRNTGRFTDYSGARQTSEGNGLSGGDSGQDKCSSAFSANLEDIEHYEFYKKNNDIPVKGTAVKVAFNKRLVVIEESSGLTIGALPTQYHYLLGCLRSGFEYVGVVNASITSPMMQVKVDILAIEND